jgi:hypothetical protein
LNLLIYLHRMARQLHMPRIASYFVVLNLFQHPFRREYRIPVPQNLLAETESRQSVPHSGNWARYLMGAETSSA